MGMDNVVVQEFSIKLPFIIAQLLSGVGIYLILKDEGLGIKRAKKIGLIFVLTPIVIYDSIFHGNPLILALFFIIFSVVFIYKEKYTISSIFLGIAATTYLFPIFFIIPYLYIVKKRESVRRMILFLIVFLFVLILGEGIPLISYVISGIPLNQGSILGGIIGVTSSGLPNGVQKVISTWGPYFIIQEVSGYIITQRMAVFVFVAVMLVFAASFLFKFKSPSIKDLISYLLSASLLFVIFGLNSAPQYLTAIAPFAILMFAIVQDFKYLYFLFLLTILDLLSFITSSSNVLFSFFYDLNPSLIGKNIFFPKILSNILYTLYVIFLFIFLSFHLWKCNSNNKKNKELNKNHDKPYLKKLHRTIVRDFGILIFLTIVTLLFVSPTILHPPKQMYSMPALMSETYFSEYNQNFTTPGKNSSSYLIELGNYWGTMDSYAKRGGNYSLFLPQPLFKTKIIGDFSQNSTIKTNSKSLYSENFTVPFRSNLVGYFVDFGNNSTPIIHLIGEGAGQNFNINLTPMTRLFRVVNISHNFFEFSYNHPIPKGNFTLSIKVNNNITLSSTKFGGNNASFIPIGYSNSINMNSDQIPELYVNSTEIKGTTLSLYITMSSLVNLTINAHKIGNNISDSEVPISINSSLIKQNNIVNISGDFDKSDRIEIKYSPPLTIYPSVILKNDPRLITGFLFLISLLLSLEVLRRSLKDN